MNDPQIVSTPEAMAADRSKERLRLWLRLLRVTRVIEGELRERLRTEHATTLPRFDVMAALHRHRSGLRMSELSSVLMVSNGNVTGIVERLVSEGLVMRHAVAGDRRATIVRLTGKGREEFATLAQEHENWVDDLLSPLDGAQAGAMVRQIDAILKDFEKQEEAQ